MVNAYLWPWLAGVAALVVAAGAVLGWRRAHERRSEKPGTVWIANSARLAMLPKVRTLWRRYRSLRLAAVMGLTIAVAGTALMASRPAHTQKISERLSSRDIVLCLDVSGSMATYDSQILKTFRTLVEQFRGERIALSIFNSTSRTVFPLTDDYSVIDAELKEGQKALDIDPNTIYEADDDTLRRYATFIAGTYSDPNGASLIGDGLANCALQFDGAGENRSRLIILATDNEVSGTPIYTLQQAVDLVDTHDAQVYGMYASQLPGGAEEVEYRTIVEKSGGHFFPTDDEDAVPTIVSDVLAQQAADIGARPRIVVEDRPAVGFVIALAGVAILLLFAWRVRE